nr:brain-specific serine protease 4 [Pan paniscus]
MVVSGAPPAPGGGCLGTFTSLLLLASTASTQRASVSSYRRRRHRLLPLASVFSQLLVLRCLPLGKHRFVLFLTQEVRGGHQRQQRPDPRGSAILNAARIPVPPACGKPQHLNRVVGGEDSTDSEWPWIVSIQKNGTHHCAGSLLTSRWVITAAHCFKDNLNKPSLFSVLLGAWQLGNPGSRSQKVGVAWVQPHPVYSWKEGARADIALVRLERSIQFSERVLPICLPDASIHLPPNTHCWISGWGSIQDGVPLPHPQTLQKLKVPIIDSEVCSHLYWRGAGQGPITEDMLCAGYLEGERDACLGDSGGPLMCQVDGAWLLAGIISWGEGCAERNRPGVYISLSAHRSWVEKIVQGVQLRGRAQGGGALRAPSQGSGAAARS